MAAERGQPFASDFSRMIQAAMLPEAPPSAMLGEVVAYRPLADHEASPVAVILGAFAAAQQAGDGESLEEVVRVGLTLLSKWAEYLVGLDRHGPMSHLPLIIGA